jgi:hypothetical protein
VREHEVVEHSQLIVPIPINLHEYLNEAWKPVSFFTGVSRFDLGNRKSKGKIALNLEMDGPRLLFDRFQSTIGREQHAIKFRSQG